MPKFILEYTDGFEITKKIFFEAPSLEALFALTEVEWDQTDVKSNDDVLTGVTPGDHAPRVRLRKVPVVTREVAS